MNKNLLNIEELRSLYAEYWREEFQIVLRSIDGMYCTKNGHYPDFEWQRNALFQFYRWVVANRNAKLMYRPSKKSMLEFPVQEVELGFEDWWKRFPKQLEDCWIGPADLEPYYDFEWWLLYPEYSRYTIEWDLDSPPEKFGDEPLNYPN